MGRVLRSGVLFYSYLAALGALAAVAGGVSAAEKQAYFGDLHVHTRYSLDAYSFGTRTGPDDAYRFAKGEAVTHPQGFAVQLDQPLDFYAVTDHAEYLGAMALIDNPAHPLYGQARELGILDPGTVAGRGRGHPQLADFVSQHSTQAERRSAWQDIVAAANKHYQPGKLTTFIGYEYTAFRDGGNLHRNVIFADENVPQDIFGRLQSMNPEDLWRWMDAQRAAGMEALAIPHNSNGSDGWMFDDKQTDGSVMDAAYADLRLRNEPLVEVSQVKGTSETHPFLSPNDEWADFEIFPYQVARWQKSRPRGSYVRDAYLTGLRVQQERGVNPYRFGMVGASDTHNTGSRFDEETYAGKVGVLDALPERRGSVPVAAAGAVPAYRQVYRIHYSAAGLTGVWAEGNNRQDIYAAFRRKETFATSGSRIRIRMAAGYDIPANFLQRKDWTRTGVVPQGAEMRGKLRAPEFAVVALRDPNGAPLQRLQIIKGWVENGRKYEKIYDVACADGLQADPQTHRCPDNGATVDVSDCSISADKGAASLQVLWTDPDYTKRLRAFYYARVLENPSCRWSTWDAVRAGQPPRPGINATLQERAWTSPVWVN